MICASCHADNRQERRYCRTCGAALVPVPCPTCRFENFPTEGWCGGCGVRLTELAAPAPSPPSDAERRQLTVMFCDLVGSTALSGQLDPEELREHIVAFQRACAEAVAGCGGFVARYMGDGMLAYFGYPMAHEDAADRAVRAGLAIVRAVRALDRPGFEPHVRVGIATGHVVVGDVIGEGASEERAVVGETPNLAARLQALADPDTVVIASRTRRLVGDGFDVEDLGRHMLKGFDEPVHAFRAVTERRRRQAVVAAPLVGRTFERTLLADRWRAAERGEGQLVELIGDAGSGKSHLLRAFADRLEGATVVRHACAAHQRSITLHPVADRIAEAAGLDLADDAARRADKLRAWVAGWSADPTDTAGVLALFSLSEATGASPEALRDGIAAALDHEIAACLHRGPALLVFEDLQWADASTLAFVERQLERLPTSRLLCVVTGRPEAELRWRSRANHSRLTLGRLEPAAAEALVRARASDLPDDVVDAIVARGDGVPGFLVELAQAATSREDAWSIPETLQDSLAAQLDRLGPAREVAQTAAVIGREFSRALLGRLISGDAVEPALRTLLDRDIAVRIEGSGDARYAFRHGLLRDVAYDGLLKRTRRALHERIAAVLVDELPDAARADPAGVALHLERAERPVEAARWYRQAADGATAHAAQAEATAHVRAGLRVLAPAADPAVADHAELWARLLVDLVRLTRFEAAHDALLAMLDQADALATPHHLHEALALSGCQRGNLWFNRGDPVRCEAAHQAALQHARRAGSVRAETQALGGLGDARLSAGDLDGAVAAMTRCVAFAEANGLTLAAGANGAVLAFAFYYRLDVEACEAQAEKVAASGKLTGDPRTALSAAFLLAVSATAAGRPDEALARAADLVGAASRTAVGLRDTTLVTTAMARAHRMTGREDEARALLARVLAECSPTSPNRLGPYALQLIELPTDRAHAVQDELLAEIAVLPLQLVMWVGELVAEAVIRRRDWTRTVKTTATLRRRFATVPRLLLWADAVEAAARWAEDPDDPDRAAQVQAIRDRAAGRETCAASCLEDLLHERDGVRAARHA